MVWTVRSADLASSARKPPYPAPFPKSPAAQVEIAEFPRVQPHPMIVVRAAIPRIQNDWAMVRRLAELHRPWSTFASVPNANLPLVHRRSQPPGRRVPATISAGLDRFVTDSPVLQAPVGTRPSLLALHHAGVGSTENPQNGLSMMPPEPQYKQLLRRRQSRWLPRLKANESLSRSRRSEKG